ncbi:hypothetical protein WA158_004654 [Blastocystis sp. Blastoise]
MSSNMFDYLTHSCQDNNIQTAAGDGELEAVKAFIAKGVNVNDRDSNGYSALHAASSYGYPEIVQYLLDNGADAVIRDSDGDSPLHMCEFPACAKLLIEHGASPEDINCEGKSCVRYAFEEEFNDMLEFYIYNKVLEQWINELGEQRKKELEDYLSNYNE